MDDMNSMLEATSRMGQDAEAGQGSIMENMHRLDEIEKIIPLLCLRPIQVLGELYV